MRVSPPDQASRGDAEPDTKEKILDAAENLFASFGYHGVSIRDITSLAGVRLALASYHFGTKDALFAAVFDRRMGHLNQARRQRLSDILCKAGDTPPPLEEVIGALIEPILRMTRDSERGGQHFPRLIAQVLNSTDERFLPIRQAYFDDVALEFIDALRRALPDHSEEEVQWGYFFMSGAMIHSMANNGRLERLSHGLCNGNDVDRLVQAMTRFMSAGLTARLLPEQAIPQAEKKKGE